MLTASQQDELKRAGYRVVFSERGATSPLVNTHAVFYPNKRPGAITHWYSQETYVTPELAWDAAWLDFQAGEHLKTHAFPSDPPWLLMD